VVSHRASRYHVGREGGPGDMRIGIVGAGAIGSVVGGLLTKAGQDVTLIDQWPEHVAAMREHGLRLSGTCGEHVVKVKACHLHEAQAIEEPFDAVFVAVKSYDTEWATALAVRHVRPDGVVVDFQNGINDERVAAIAGRGRTLGCVITIGAGMYEPGHATRTDTGKIGFKIGELDGQDTRRARAISAAGDLRCCRTCSAAGGRRSITSTVTSAGRAGSWVSRRPSTTRWCRRSTTTASAGSSPTRRTSSLSRGSCRVHDGRGVRAPATPGAVGAPRADAR